MLKTTLLILLLISSQALSNPFATEKPNEQQNSTNSSSISFIDSEIDSFTPIQLSVSQAFQFNLEQKESDIYLKIDIAKDHNLYKDKLKFSTINAGINPYTLPEGSNYNDPEFGEVKVFSGFVEIPLELWKSIDGQLVIEYQGCSKSLCYPPETLSFNLEDIPTTKPKEAVLTSPTVDSGDSKESNSLVWYFLIGIGLALTPCVFPMYPIISATVLGNGAKSIPRTFSLSLSYVQGMALVYSLVGLLVALVGLQFQILLQHPIVLSVIATLFVVLAGGMFGFYTLQPPIKYQSKVGQVSQKQEGGSLFKSFFMGAVSGLVASPCTTAPLVGILLIIAQSGDLVNGFFSLYFLSLGMGVPLIAFALTGGKLMPKAGYWMDSVKTTFGFGLLAMAVYFLSRFIPSNITEILFGGLVIAFIWSLAYSLLFKNKEGQVTGKQMFSLMALLFISLSFVQIYLAPKFLPESKLTNVTAIEEDILFTKVDSKSEFLRIINSSGKPIILDLYAEWCSACIQYEKNTFSNSEVQSEFENFRLIQVDLTKTTDLGTYVMKKYNVLGLPAILFFDGNGEEISGSRISGYMPPAEFLERLN